MAIQKHETNHQHPWIPSPKTCKFDTFVAAFFWWNTWKTPHTSETKEKKAVGRLQVTLSAAARWRERNP